MERCQKRPRDLDVIEREAKRARKEIPLPYKIEARDVVWKSRNIQNRPCKTLSDLLYMAWNSKDYKLWRLIPTLSHFHTLVGLDNIKEWVCCIVCYSLADTHGAKDIYRVLITGDSKGYISKLVGRLYSDLGVYNGLIFTSMDTFSEPEILWKFDIKYTYRQLYEIFVKILASRGWTTSLDTARGTKLFLDNSDILCSTSNVDLFIQLCIMCHAKRLVTIRDVVDDIYPALEIYKKNRKGSNILWS